jgi:hypothetical protein
MIGPPASPTDLPSLAQSASRRCDGHHGLSLLAKLGHREPHSKAPISHWGSSNPLKSRLHPPREATLELAAIPIIKNIDNWIGGFAGGLQKLGGDFHHCDFNYDFPVAAKEPECAGGEAGSRGGLGALKIPGLQAWRFAAMGVS